VWTIVPSAAATNLGAVFSATPVADAEMACESYASRLVVGKSFPEGPTIVAGDGGSPYCVFGFGARNGGCHCAYPERNAKPKDGGNESKDPARPVDSPPQDRHRLDDRTTIIVQFEPKGQVVRRETPPSRRAFFPRRARAT